MALRALTPSKAAYCSECGADAPPELDACSGCGQAFDGSFDAVLCPICNVVNPADATECAKCAAKFPEKKDLEAPGEEAYLRRILQLSREKAKSRAATGPPSPTPSGAVPQSMTEEGFMDELEKALWKLAEPFDRMVQDRRKRLEQMEALIDRARERVRALGASTEPNEVQEREALKREIEELLLEKEDILKLEEGLVEMENTYRNILRMQQEELKAREASLRSRLDAFRKELETRERTFGQLRERESDMIRREDEFRRLVNRLHEREKEFTQREELMREKAQLLDERHHALSEAEVDLERRRWELQQKAAAAPSGLATKAMDGTITVKPADAQVSEMRSRLTELEEQMEGWMEDKNRLTREREELVALRGEVVDVMRILDDLLSQLPEDRIREFARSEAFARYERLLDRLQL